MITLVFNAVKQFFTFFILPGGKRAFIINSGPYINVSTIIMLWPGNELCIYLYLLGVYIL